MKAERGRERAGETVDGERKREADTVTGREREPGGGCLNKSFPHINCMKITKKSQ